MPRQTKARKATRNPALKARKLVGDRLESPVLSWESPPKTVPFPPIEKLVGLPDDQLLEVLQRFGITQSWVEAETAAAEYIQRVSSRKWTRKELREETRRIAGLNPDGTFDERTTQRAARSLAKRTYREYTHLYSLHGDDPAKAEFIWLGDGGEGTCDKCAERLGEIATFAEHAAQGLPGASWCEGGDDDRCQLTRVA